MTTIDAGCSAFEQLLSSEGVLVADGAMGTALFEAGLESGGCPELMNVENPGIVGGVHAAYLAAGANVILTNTFGGNRRRLALHGAQDRVAELNAAAAAIADRARREAPAPALVAGSIGPTGDLFAPLGPLDADSGAAVFREQAESLASAGVDILWIETMSSFEELDAAVAGCSGLGVPVTATLSFDTNGRTMMGVSGRAFGEWWAAVDDRPAAIGANCGIGPGDAVAAAFDISAVAPDVPIIAKANCGMPLFASGEPEFPVGPDGMADYVELAVRSGARIVGACCGSTPDHIAAIRAAVSAGTDRGRPDRDEIVERLDAASAGTPRTRRRTGRRA